MTQKPESVKQESATVVNLSEKIIADIRRRGMTVGDRYLTCEEAQRAFDVGKGLTNRALRLLGEQGVLERRQRSGTFIGRSAPIKSASKIRTIHVLLPADRRDAFGYPFDMALHALCKEIPNASVQFSFVPEQDEVLYVKELLTASLATKQCFGVVSVSGTHELNTYLAESGVPAVAQSSYDFGKKAIPAVDLDLREGGRLLAQYLVEQGHSRIALIHAAKPRRGDNEFFDGISEALTVAKLPHNSLIYRFVPLGIESIQAETRRLLDLEDRPTAFIGRVGSIAEVIAKTISENNLCVPDDAEVVFIDHTTAKAEQSPHPHVCPKSTFEETILALAKMLRRLTEGEAIQNRRILVPVQFHVPKNYRCITKKADQND